MHCSLLSFDQHVEATTVAFQEAFVDKFLPDLAAEAVGGLDRHDLRLRTGERAVAQLRIFFELSQLHSLLERLERFLQFFIGAWHVASCTRVARAGPADASPAATTDDHSCFANA